MVREYPGGYDDWLSQRIVKPQAGGSKTATGKSAAVSEKSQSPSQFSPALQRELKDLLKKIEKTEAEQEELYRLMAELGFYQKDPKEISRIKLQGEAHAAELAQMYDRWEYLEKMKKL
jgi:ATP-binding cassette subfamily F protein uup